MLRITFDSPEAGYYSFAYFQTKAAQQMIRRGKTGSVIDHLDEPHMGAQQIPWFEQSIRDQIAQKIEQAWSLRERAREVLARLHDEVEEATGGWRRPSPLYKGWVVRARQIGNRVDAAYWDPGVFRWRTRFSAAGGERLGAVAVVSKPKGRYKTNYVSSEYGTPLLSGTHIHQYRPWKVKYMSRDLLPKASTYRLFDADIVFQADGRVEGGLGLPVMVTSDRDGWLASGHVGRAHPKVPEDAGYIYLALRCEAVLLQVKALACGSVVDALYPDDVAEVILPPRDLITQERAEQAVAAWVDFARAQAAEKEATLMVEEQMEFWGRQG